MLDKLEGMKRKMRMLKNLILKKCVVDDDFILFNAEEYLV